MLAGGTDATGEHQVELDGFGDLVIRVWVPDGIFFAELAEFGPGIVIQLHIVKGKRPRYPSRSSELTFARIVSYSVTTSSASLTATALALSFFFFFLSSSFTG